MRTLAGRCHPAHMTYVTYDPPDPPRPTRRRRSRALVVAGAVAGAVLIVAGTLAILLATRAPAPADRSAPAVAGAGFPRPSDGSAPTTVRIRVAELLTKLGCGGAVIGTQLYSRETGRCPLGGGDVTLAVFDTDALRDQWVSAARQYGGTFVIGTRWAAMVEMLDAAGTVASKLGGKRL